MSVEPSRSHFSRASVLTDHASHRNLEPQHWDFALTCCEPLKNVTGGIGTYTRLLLRLLALDTKNKSTLILSASEVDDDVKAMFGSATIVVAPPRERRHDIALENIGDEQMRFSFAIAELIHSMEIEGHSFNFIEFPDYGAEAYYTLKMRRHGQIRAPRIAIRLHSPYLMLLDDNSTPLYTLDVNRRKSIMYEVFCYRHADIILYGVDAMYERILNICARFGVDFSSRSQKIPHPYPDATSHVFGGSSNIVTPKIARIKDHKIVVTYVGRLENRKGVVRMFETMAACPKIVALLKKRNFQFQLAGRDLPYDDQSTNGDLIRAAMGRHGLIDCITFVGNVDHETLTREILPRSNGFVFPSIFENYPNALLETLVLGKPTLASSRGGMPELAAPFSHVACYDPLQSDANVFLLGFLNSLLNAPERSFRDSETKAVYRSVADASNRSMITRYRSLINSPIETNSKADEIIGTPRVGFVVPHFRNTPYVAACLQSIREAAKKDDEIVVVDDASPEDEFRFLEAIVSKFNEYACPQIQVVRLEINRGPSEARNTGVRNLTHVDLVQFLDADDMIDAKGFAATRTAMALNADIDMAFGIQRSFGALNHYWMPTDANALTVLDENFSHSAILIKLSVFKKLNGFASALRYHYEDWEFNARFCLAGYKGEMVVAETQRYRVRPSSRTTDNKAKTLHSRHALLDNIARSTTLSGDRHVDMLGSALAIYASKLVHYNLISAGTGQEPSNGGLVTMLRVLKQTLKNSDLPKWRKRISCLGISLIKRTGRISTKKIY